MTYAHSRCFLKRWIKRIKLLAYKAKSSKESLMMHLYNKIFQNVSWGKY